MSANKPSGGVIAEVDGNQLVKKIFAHTCYFRD